jgi:putative ABC transport system substrate-binding protein
VTSITHRRSRLAITLLTLGAFLLAGCGAMQQSTPAPKSFSIGVVSGGSNMDPVLEAFKAGMAELGYVEGKNVTYVYNGPATSPDKLNPIAKSVVEAKVDLILAMSTPATKASQTATAGTNIPVVFLPVTDPVKSGFVQSIQSPGGNLTGISAGIAFSGRRFEWLVKVAPQTKRVYIPHDPGDEASVLALAPVKEAATKLGTELTIREVKNADEISAALSDIPKDVDAMFILPGSQVGSRLSDFIKASIERKLPLSTPILSQINAGALVSYAWSPPAIGKQAARIADRILKGTKPVELPVESAEYYLGINLKTAQSIGLEIPDDLLRQAVSIVR